MSLSDDFFLEGMFQGKKRKFRVSHLSRSHNGSSGGSFQVSEVVEGQVVIHGHCFSWPTFSDACRVVSQSTSRLPVRTGTFDHLKERNMAVKKKSSSKQPVTKKSPPPKKLTPAEQVEAAQKNSDAIQGKTAATPVAVVVQAKDGKWLYGLDEEKMRETAKGKYDNAADASTAATKDHDIVVNTGPAPERKKTTWAAPVPATTGTLSKKQTIAPLSDGVSLKKVCVLADNIDPRLARRILRTKGKKPGGRWEWPAGEVDKIVELLKVEAKKAGGK